MNLSIAPSTSFAQRDSKSSPMQLALLGRRLVGVIPGSVFISSTIKSGADSSVIMKSTLQKSLHPQTLKAVSAALQIAARAVSEIFAGNSYAVDPDVYLRLKS